MKFKKDLEKILSSNKNWKKEFKETYGYIQSVIGLDNSLAKTVTITYSDTIIKMPLTHYVINLIMWRPCIKLNIQWDESFVFDCSNITQSVIKDYLDNVYIRPYRMKVDDIRTLNLEMAKVIEKLKLFCEDFGVILGITYNFYQLHELVKNNPRALELFNTKIPDGLQQSEIEDFAKEKLNELVDILKQSDTGFAPLLNSGAGINIGQLQELMVVIANKPDLNGNTYPVPINTNIMFGGLDKPSHYALDSSAGKKAMIMNKKYTGNSGYFARKLNLLNSDTVLDQHTEDCGTKHLLPIKVVNKEILKRLEGRYYKSSKKSIILKVVKITDTFLIGKTIYLRSPIYCLGDKICKKCYGELYNINREINIGMIAATIINSRFTQNILSSKHLLKTKSMTITFDGKFYDYLSLTSNEISKKDVVINEKDLYIHIKMSDIETDLMDEYDENDESVPLSIAEEVTCEKIYICSEVNGYINKLLKVKENNSMSLKCTEYMRKLINKYDRKNGIIMIPLDQIDEDEVLFSIDVANHELTKTLNAVKNLLEKKEHLGCKSIREMAQKFNELLIDGKIYSHSVHAEIICRNLLRSTTDILERPDFSEKNPKYQILTLQKALMTNPSPIISLSYERLDAQLKTALTYRKFKPSILDKLFMAKYKEFYNTQIEDYRYEQDIYKIEPEEDE